MYKNVLLFSFNPFVRKNLTARSICGKTACRLYVHSGDVCLFLLDSKLSELLRLVAVGEMSIKNTGPQSTTPGLWWYNTGGAAGGISWQGRDVFMRVYNRASGERTDEQRKTKSWQVNFVCVHQHMPAQFTDRASQVLFILNIQKCRVYVYVTGGWASCTL